MPYLPDSAYIQLLVAQDVKVKTSSGSSKSSANLTTMQIKFSNFLMQLCSYFMNMNLKVY